jgi:hypothetical protein
MSSLNSQDATSGGEIVLVVDQGCSTQICRCTNSLQNGGEYDEGLFEYMISLHGLWQIGQYRTYLDIRHWKRVRALASRRSSRSYICVSKRGQRLVSILNLTHLGVPRSGTRHE